MANVTREDGDWNVDLSPGETMHLNTAQTYVDGNINIVSKGNVFFAKGTGTAAKTTSPYNYSKWEASISNITELEDGLTIAYQVPVAGNGTYGTCLQINELGYHPVVRAVNTMVSTRYDVNSTVLLTYNSNITGTVYENSASSSTIQGCWICINDVDNNDTSTAYNTYDYYLRPKANQAIYRYKICALDIDNMVVPLVTTNQSDTTLVAKQTTQVPFRASTGLFYYASTSTVSAGGIVGAQLLRRTHSLTGAQYTFNGTVGTTTCLTTYKAVYIKGSYNRQSDLFTLVNSTGTDWFVQVPNITANIKYTDYFTEGSYYMLVGYTYSTANYLSLVTDNITYYFDGTNLTPVENIDTTYESKAAASGGTDVSLVTTGEKATWNKSIPFENDYCLDANTWLTNGYIKVKNTTTNLPSVCTADKDKWGILFFIVENATRGTGTQLFYPIDGAYNGKVFSRSLKDAIIGGTDVNISDWELLMSSSGNVTISQLGLNLQNVTKTVGKAISRYSGDLNFTNDGNASITYTNSGTRFTPIQFRPGDATGAGIVIGADGLTVVGGGESAQNYVDLGVAYNTKRLVLTSDDSIYFMTNCQDISQRVASSIDTAGSLSINNVYASGTISAENVQVPKTQSAIDGGVPAAGSITDWTGGGNYRTFIGTESSSGTNQWQNMISLRHRNGHGDGANYGMQLYSSLTSNDSLKYQQQYDGNWKTARTILDTGNSNVVTGTAATNTTTTVTLTRPVNASRCMITVSPNYYAGNQTSFNGHTAVISSITASTNITSATNLFYIGAGQYSGHVTYTIANGNITLKIEAISSTAYSTLSTYIAQWLP